MIHHSSSRNHRSKGSNVKKILQVLVLLAVACWLVYQVKHSREKKAEFARNDEIKSGKVSEEIYLGRKGDAGSENVVIIDTHAKDSDENIEMKPDEDQHDVPVINNDDNSSEMHQNHELADSQESNVGGGDMLLLPSEEGANSSDHNGNSNQESENVEESEHLNDEEKHEMVKSDLVTSDVDETERNKDSGKENEEISADQTEISKNSGKENEESSADQTEGIKEDEGISGRDDSQEASVNDEASKEKGVGSYEHSSSLPEIPLDDARVSSSEGDASTANDQVDESHSGSNHDLKNVEANNESFKEGEVEESRVDFDHELKDVDADKENLNEREIDTKAGNFSEKTVNNSSEEMKINLESEKETKDLSSDEKAQNSSNTSAVASDESQVDRASVDSQEDKASEQGNVSETDNSEVVQLQANNEVSGETENSQSNFFESKNVTDTPEKEISAGEITKSQGNEEAKVDGELNDEAVTSPKVDEKINVEDSTNKIPAGELVQAGEGSSSEAESTAGSNEDGSKTEQISYTAMQQQEEVAEQNGG